MAAFLRAGADVAVGAGLGAIGIYNQSAILLARRENKDAANGLTVLTIQLGITIGALCGSAVLVVAGPLLAPAAAALPVLEGVARKLSH